jgi:hypothetical protein
MTDTLKEELLPETILDQGTYTKIKDQKDNLAIFIDNIIGFCRIEYTKIIDSKDVF